MSCDITQKVKILWVSLEVPFSKVAHAGGQNLNFYFNKFNSDQRFEICLVAETDIRNREIFELEHSGYAEHIIYHEHTSLWRYIKRIEDIDSKFNPWSEYAGLASRYSQRKIMGEILKLKNCGYEPDIVILEWTQRVLLVHKVKRLFPTAKFVAVEADVAYVGFERRCLLAKGVKKSWLRIKAKKLKKIELEALRVCDVVMPNNPDNIDLLVSYGIEKSKCFWQVPYFNNLAELQRNLNGRDILFYGAMNRPENYLSAIWFIENVMSKLNGLGVRFVIVGANPPSKLLHYANDRIVVTGYVENVSECFANAICFVAPLVLGAGIKIKVLEALSAGLLVLTNDIGIEGIHVHDDEGYIHCSSADDYVRVIKGICAGSINPMEFGLQARKFINSISFERCAENYKNMLFNLI